MKKSKGGAWHILLLVVVVLLAAGITAYYYILDSIRGSQNVAVEGENITNFFPFIPVWIAILPAIIAARKKKGLEPSAEQKKYLTILVGITILLVLATVLLIAI